MEKSKRVAILAVHFGNGHWQAAHVLKKAIEERYPWVEVEVVNYLIFAGWLFDWLTRLGYHDLMIKIPWLYRRFFAFTNRLRPDSFCQRLINRCGASRFLRYVRQSNPDLLISTFPVPTAVVSQLKARHLLDLPLVTVITDYTLHKEWVQPGTDLYIVATEAMATELKKLSQPHQLVVACGIPVDPQVGERGSGGGSQLTLLPRMSADLPLVLVINGATNFEGDLKRVCELLAEFPVPLAALVLAVNDPGLRLRLRRMTRKSKNRVLITGYSNAVLDFMDSATCLICKAGGMTVSEALAKELPMLIYRTLPCQEEKNRDYLVEAGTALSAETIDELRTALNRLLLDPELRTNMQRQASLLKKPGAARDAAQLLSPYLTPGSQSAARRWR